MGTELSIACYTLGPLATNCYLIKRDNQAIVIDPGMNPQSLLKAIEPLDIEAIVLTHAHFDHIASVDQVRTLKQCPVYLHELEADWLTTPHKNGSTRWPDVTPPISTTPAEFTLAEGQDLTLLDVTFKVFHTPGHSPGSVSLLYENHLFSGDVLFNLSVGRTDLPEGSTQQLYDSIHTKLFTLPDEVNVYPGHGPGTTIGFEKQHNPYV